jgi:hypothetical protein
MPLITVLLFILIQKSSGGEDNKVKAALQVILYFESHLYKCKVAPAMKPLFLFYGSK